MATQQFISEKIEQELERGQKIEDVFTSLMMKTGKFSKTFEANNLQDKHEHWDRGFITKKDGKKILIDVKGIKKFYLDNINKKEFSENFHTVELLNVYGKLGWIFGLSDYIAFEVNDRFICVDRNELTEYILNVVINDKEQVKHFIDVINTDISTLSVIQKLHRQNEISKMISQLNGNDNLIDGVSTLIDEKLYKKYRRDKRSDITVDIKKSDLEKLKKFEIFKSGEK